jgi:hypothetical protein
VAPLKTKYRAVVLLLGLVYGSASYSETIDVKLGADRTDIVSSAYQKSSSTVASIALVYGRQVMGRWSAFAEYRNTMDNSLSAGIVGLAFDSEELRTKGGLISGDGTAEITKVPIWLTRYYLGVGVFRLVDILRSNDRSLGSRNLVPVKASPLGVKLGASLYRFMGDSFAVSAGGSYVLANAGNFGISSLSINLGVMYNIY